MARRGAGEGSIYRRGTAYGRTRAEVLEKLDELRQRVASASWADPGTLRVGEYLNLWLEGAPAASLIP